MVSPAVADVYLEELEEGTKPVQESIRCGIEKRKAWEWANTRKGYWHISNSWILSRALNNDNLRRANYPLLMDCYRKVVS